MAAELNSIASGTLESPEDAGKGEPGIVNRWNLEWDLATKAEEAWRKRARKAIDRYRDGTDEDTAGSDEKKRQRVNILFSNTQTLAPSLYNAKPNPDVRRRFRDADPLGKGVAEILERALAYSTDAEDFDSIMQTAVLDYLLPGRAVTRVRYMPAFRTVDPTTGQSSDAEQDPSITPPDVGTGPAERDEQDDEVNAPDDDEPYEELAFEECICEPVQWDLFRRGPGRRWAEVPWVGFEHHLTRQEAVDKFKDSCPEVENIDLDFVPENIDGEKAEKDPDTFKRMTVREVWDRDKRQVIFIAPGYMKGPLKTEDDPLQLEGFFPIPRPLYAVESTDTLVPIEEYRMYESQARELDRLAARINRIISGLKLRGIFDSTVAEIEDLFRSDDNAMIPAKNVIALAQAGGLDKFIWMLPIKDAASVLVELYNQRDRTIQSIYEITGIGDIMRAQTDPRETLGAQRLKSGWGTMRLQRRQREVQRYARDLIRLKAEIIANHFAPETLKLMTGVELPMAAEKDAQIQALQAQAMQIQQQRAMAAQQQAMQAQAAQQQAMQVQAAQQPQPPMLGHNGGPAMPAEAPPGMAA